MNIQSYCSLFASSTVFFDKFKYIENADNSSSVYCDSLLLFKIVPLKTKINLYSKYRINISGYENIQFTETTAELCKYSIAKEEHLMDIIALLFEDVDNFIIKNYTAETFGCCHRYVECSDQRKCLHPDILHSKGCMYRVNLENGRIFYGKNKNI